ncbi:MAG TPA: hypothetical protein GXX48_05230 [Ochrobactrum intermedium]|uniref:Uncharacterized protein n=1 Tax=Brucella intermedia TaxID=94625 RepID=A0A7V6P9Z9_9HYPH|nr:hypothetical protein [Brucella intermedia]HHV67030.1 hypothetical protein [Brucella intermedia]
MTQHCMVKTSVAGVTPPATDPRASVAIPDGKRRVSGPVPSRQHRAEALRSRLSASILALPYDDRAVADTSRRSKST